MYQINFFGKAGEVYLRTRNKDQKFMTWSLVAFAAVVAVFVAVLSYNLYLGNELEDTARKQTQTKQSLAGNQSVEVTYLIFSQKLKAIAEIFELRNNKQQAINYLANLFGDKVFISGVTYDGEDQVLSLNLRSKDVFDLEKLMVSLNSQEVRTNFSSLTKSNIRRSEDGSYDLKLTLELKNQAKTAQAASKTSTNAPTQNPVQP